MNWANSWQDIDVNSRGSLTAVSSLDGITIVRVAADPLTGALLVSSVSTFTTLAATGSVNGTNTEFTFTQEPGLIVSDGAIYQMTDNNGNIQWSWNSGTMTVTMEIPPQSAIFGLQAGSGGSGGNTLTMEIPSGTVNDSNTSFTVSNTPLFISVNGAVYSDGYGLFQSYGGGTITLSSPVGTGGFILSYYNS